MRRLSEKSAPPFFVLTRRSSPAPSDTKSSPSNLIQPILQAICHSIVLTLLRQQLQQYRNSPHIASVRQFRESRVEEEQKQYALQFFKTAKYVYNRLFMKYFFFVLTLQFK